MSGRIRLALVLHNHQPVGNFEGVFEGAYQDSYAPFLEVLRDFPEIPVTLHTSGSLMEWLVQAHPEYIDAVRRLVERGQVEILGGPFYEPILASIPPRDRVGQIRAYKSYLEKLFHTPVRGMWVPERVWEQSFTSDIVTAGMEYTILDDFHFRSAGLREDDLYGHYVTEDYGKLLKIFPGSERLRYTIPFADPQETIDYLRGIAERHPNAVIAFGDDGEKFGTWPGTKEHVYGDGWLRTFFQTLQQNSDWLRVATLAEAVDQTPPIGKQYLPDTSYREMTEWASPTQRQLDYAQLVRQMENRTEEWERIKPFVRVGFWRNFLVKYPEANEMYARMLQVSRKLEQLSTGEQRVERPELLEAARTELYRGQCNCPYWHGAFGGLYLPHLRNAIYSHLIAADNLLQAASGRSGHWIEATADDYNLDARKEAMLSGDKLAAYFAPSRGGHLYELDIRSTKHNLLATLNRRPEPYHDRILKSAGLQDDGDESLHRIHDVLRFKQPGLEKKIGYDPWPRKSLVDHFLQPGLRLDTFQVGHGDLGDFVQGVYETVLRRSDERVEVRMWREGKVGPYRVKVTKTAALDLTTGGNLEVLYELENLPPQLPIHFGVEFNFAGMAAGAPDRYFYDADGQQLGPLESVHDLQETDRIGLVDEWLGTDVSLDLSEPAGIWTFPIQTVSQSEGGFELVHQSSVVVPHWEFDAPQDGRWSVRIILSVDTSAALARQLAEPAVVG